jgi:hypothetical protein
MLNINFLISCMITVRGGGGGGGVGPNTFSIISNQGVFQEPFDEKHVLLHIFLIKPSYFCKVSSNHNLVFISRCIFLRNINFISSHPWGGIGPSKTSPLSTIVFLVYLFKNRKLLMDTKCLSTWTSNVVKPATEA